ncbi:MAG TPA: ATP-binding protein [Actinomycetota bacterium]
MLSECVDRVMLRWPQLSISLNIDDDAAAVRADPVFLDRVGANLLENAAKAASAAGRVEIEIEARCDETRVVVAVVDHGMGIPPELRRGLFFPFYQADERTAHLGTGLGLAICKGFLASWAASGAHPGALRTRRGSRQGGGAGPGSGRLPHEALRRR